MTTPPSILDLNDDCLLKVFEYSNLSDLSSIADACNRFKQNARDCFAYSKWTHLLSTKDFQTHGDMLNQMLLKTSKVLRNFGHPIVIFKERSMLCNGLSFYRWTFQRKVIELLSRHCHRWPNMFQELNT